MDKNENIVYKKAFGFAVRIINLYKYLTNDKREYVLSKQLLRSGTSIGANVREGLEAQSKKDFIAKLSIALKEAGETEYWIELLMETGYMEKAEGNGILDELREIIRILNSIIRTSRKSIDK